MIIHMVWLGNNYKSDIVEYTQKINNDHDIIVWRDDSLLPDSWRHCYNKYATVPQMKSDLLRLCALRKYGGLYIDFDCVMKQNASKIVSKWNNFTIPAMCYSRIMPGNILYCPNDWNYWDNVDKYVTEYNNPKTCILTFDHFLYKSLPQESYTIINDCEKFPTCERFITDRSEIIRYFRYPQIPNI